MDSIHLVVDLRNHEDIELLRSQISELESKNQRLQQDIRIWTHYAVELQEAYDDIRYLKSILKANNIAY